MALSLNCIRRQSEGLLWEDLPRMLTFLQPLSLPHGGFPLQHNFHFQFQATNEDMPLQYRSQFSVSVPKSIGNVSKLLYTKILTFGFPWNINIFAKTLSFYSPPLIFLKERLALLKRLHKMMTVCDPVFSLAITLGPKTLFQPLIESITVASHPLFMHSSTAVFSIFLFLLQAVFSLFLFFVFWKQWNATFFQQQLQITLQGKKFTSLFQTHNWEKSSFYSMCISTDLRKYVTGVKSILPFSKLITGKSQVFSTNSYLYLHGYTQIWPPVPNRLKESIF